MSDSFFVGSTDVPESNRGWFLGDFLPEGSPNKIKALEIAWKKLGPSDRDPIHVHTIATEVTIILKGRIDFLVEDGEGNLKQVTLFRGHYLLLRPGVKCGVKRFYKGTEVIVVKTPSKPDDKEVVK